MEKKPVEKWVEVYATNDESEAEIIRGLLESEGIRCRAESARVSQLPVSIGALGEVVILVHGADFEKARRVMEATRMEEGEGA